MGTTSDGSAAPRGVGESALSPTARLVGMLHGKIVAQAICAAAELGVADFIGSEPAPIEMLARAAGAHAPSLYRLLRLLASVGIFKESENHAFMHSDLSVALKKDTPGSVHGIARMVGAEWHSVAETKMMHSLRTGETAFEFLHGKGVFEYLAADPQAGAIFDEAMTGLSQAINHTIAVAYEFSWARRVVDVGGGQGSLLTTILRAHPSLEGTIFDAPQVIARAAAHLKASGLESRCKAVGGDFFRQIPPHADLYLLKYILHDWNDEAALAILKSCREAAAPTSRLLVVEDLVGPANIASGAKLTDIEMLVIFGGRERTQAEYAQLLTKAGFELKRVIRTELPVFLLEAVPS